MSVNEMVLSCKVCLSRRPLHFAELTSARHSGSLSSGCFALAVGAAGGVAGAVYVLGKLTEEINHDVPVVHAAAVQAMKDLELKLSEDRSDKLTAHMQSECSDGANVWIEIHLGSPYETDRSGGCDSYENRARQINEAIKAHLARPT